MKTVGVLCFMQIISSIASSSVDYGYLSARRFPLANRVDVIRFEDAYELLSGTQRRLATTHPYGFRPLFFPPKKKKKKKKKKNFFSGVLCIVVKDQTTVPKA